MYQWASGTPGNHYSVEITDNNGLVQHTDQVGAVGTDAHPDVWVNPGWAQVGHPGTFDNLDQAQATAAMAWVTAQMALPPQPYNQTYRSCYTYVLDVLIAAGIPNLPDRPIMGDDGFGNRLTAGLLGVWLRHLTED